MKTPLLAAVAIGALAAHGAAAQVSVPLPGRPTPTPAPVQPAPDTDRDVEPPVDAPQRAPGAAEEPPRLQIPIGAHGRPDINPYERDFDLTVPLMYRQRSLGELPIRLTFDDRFLVRSAEFLRLIRPLLSPEAHGVLVGRLAETPLFTGEDLGASGVALDYDPGTLSVVLLRIEPAQRAVERVFDEQNLEDEQPDIPPAGFSAYLNINVGQSYIWNGPTSGPTVSLQGATRVGNIVFEGDGLFTDRSGFGGFGDQGYVFDRNYARLVYDQPNQYRRWLAGDLQPETRGQQGFVRMGGIGVSRQRRVFNELRSTVLQGDRQLILQRDSTVRILRNGVPFREIRLDAGSYDFSDLPLLAGSNDIQIEVRDETGFVQNLAYRSYLDPIDLVPGDYEYGLYVGPTSRTFGRSPVYDGPVALTGFYRKAFVDRPAIGVGLQLSEEVQNVVGQTQFVVGGGGRLLFDLGLSNAQDVGAGFSAGVSYDLVLDRGASLDALSVRADYRSADYATLGSPRGNSQRAASLSAQYSRTFTQNIVGFVNASYNLGARGRGDSYRIGAGASARLTRQLSLRAGVEYAKAPALFQARGGGFGFTIGLIYQPDFRTRAEARHESVFESTRLSVFRSGSNRIGSVSLGGSVGHTPDQVVAEGFADYIGNRFDASISHASFGTDFGGIGEGNVTSLRVGTSLAYADGAFGVGRRINDSFALLTPHPTLRGRSVVAGQSLARNEYTSRSGVLGAAVNNFLTSYITQSIQYDVADVPLGYDIGPGVVRVRPPFRSGYHVRVGTDAFVSALGTLQLADGKPVSLAGGRVFALDGQEAEPVPFFTNSVGRFAVPNLKPGVRYRVELYESGAQFEFDVPSDTTGLVNLNTIALGAAN